MKILSTEENLEKKWFFNFNFSYFSR